MRIVGIVLIILGAIGLIWGGITYTKRRDTINVGPIKGLRTAQDLADDDEGAGA